MVHLAHLSGYTGTKMENYYVPQAATHTQLGFATQSDAERYEQLNYQLEQHHRAIAAIQREREAILRRATWTLDGIMDREG